MESIGSRIKSRRKIIEASQKDLAKRIGVSQASITYWESDTNEPAGGNLLALANAFGVTPQWLLTGRGDAPALPNVSPAPSFKANRNGGSWVPQLQ